MKLRPLVILSIVGLVLLAGCATVSFKRGAGPGNAKADEDACRATSASADAYAACLRERGWMVRTPGTAEEAAAPEPEPEPKPAVEVPPAAPARPAPAADAPKPAAATTKPPATSPASAAPVAPATTGGAKPVGSVPAQPMAPAAKKPLDPLTKLTVSSWWKLGGTTADLERAVAACVDELGAAHQPNVGPTEVTVALRDCLRGKKWFPVGGTGGTGAR